MIRREHPCSAAGPGWALISQVEHARLAGEMAAEWGSPFCPPLAFADQTLPAITHHDDGWALWERQPGVDPASGRPLNFTEMPQDESLVIWQRSIDTAAGYGPLAGYMVSSHFTALLRHQNAWQRLGSAHHTQARAYLDEQDHQQAQWLGQWQQNSPEVHTRAAALAALHWLQFFDALSLWLCMARRDQPHAMPLPTGQELRLVPQPGGEVSWQRVAVAPWPFSQPEIRLQLTARSVAQAAYRTAGELASAPSATIMLDWALMPSSAGCENP